MNRSAERRGALLLAAGDGLTVFLLLAGGLWGCFSAYFYVMDSPWRLLAVCAPASLVGAALWSSRKGGWAALGLLAGLLLLACRPWEEGVSLLSILRDQWEMSVRTLPDTCTLLLLAGILGLVLGWVVVWARAWYLAALLVITPVVPAILSGVLPAWPALLASTAGWGSMLLTALYGRRDRQRLGRGVLLSTAGMAAFLAALTLALPQEGYTRPQWATDMRDGMFRFFSTRLDGLTDWVPEAWREYGGGQGGTGTDLGGLFAGQFDGEKVDLLAAGPRRYTGREVLTIQTDDGNQSGLVYLRGGSAGIYTGQSWETVPSSGVDYGGAHFPALTGTGERHTMTIRHLTGGDMGFYPYRLAAMPETLRREDDSGGLIRPGREYEITYRPGGPAEGFQELSWDFAQLEAAYHSFVLENYLGVSHDAALALAPLLEEVGRTAVSVDPALPEQFRDTVAAADRTAAVLSTYAYSLTVPAMEAGEDFVTHFLEQGRGYCMHFATAGALLLRMQGIPARYVSGYVCQPEGTGPATVRDSNAHAWVEIYLDGYGWYPVEMTPAYRAENDIHGAVSQDPDAPQAPEEPDTPEAPDTPEEAPGEDLPQTPENSGQTGENPSAAPEREPLDLSWLRWPLGAGAALAVLWGLYQLALRTRRRSREAADANRSAIDAYRRCLRLARWGGEMDPALEELARKAKFSQHTLTEEERSAMAALVRGEAESLDARLSPGKRAALRYWFGLF